MEFDVSGKIQAGWVRDAYIACAVLVVYEYLLQLDAEVEFFWKQSWSLAKCLFLWSRYYALGYNISNAVAFMIEHPSYEMCSSFFHWQNTGASLQVITTHIILQLRLYAMYGNTRKILFLFICMTLGEALAMGIIFGLTQQKTIGTNNPLPGVFICADADLDGRHWIVYYWVAVLIIESILLSLAVYKAWQHRKSQHGGTLMQQLTRESVIYFFAIFWIYLANLIIWYINRITLNELGTAPSFVLSSIFANRLLISVRSSRYHGTTDDDTYHPSVHFSKSNPSQLDENQTGNNDIELTTLNERAGHEQTKLLAP